MTVIVPLCHSIVNNGQRPGLCLIFVHAKVTLRISES